MGSKNIIFLSLLIAYVVVLSGSMTSRENAGSISELRIHIKDSIEYQFIHSNNVAGMLDSKQFRIIGQPVKEIRLADIEDYLEQHQIIKNAEAYITEPGILHVDVRQKSPFVRITNQNGQGYYLDREGYIIPLSDSFSPFVLIASGNIREPFKINQTASIFDIRHDSLANSQRIIYDLYELALFIDDDEFLRSQIEQIYVNEKNGFELVPRVGPHIIEFGKAENIEEKFSNLKLLYTQGLNNLGWNQYIRINLKYQNQIVCTKIQ